MTEISADRFRNAPVAETAGKRKSVTTRNGNRWAPSSVRGGMGCFEDQSDLLQAQFRRLAAIRGNQRAIIAVASSILTIGYHMLQEGTT